MQIESGKYYKTRDGRVVGPVGPSMFDDEWKYQTDNGNRLYNENGKNYYDPDKDLIAPAYPETGTLQEIGAKVGDMVVMGNDHDDKMTVIECPPRVGKYFVDEYELEGIVSGEGIYSGEGKWRIITRASESKPSPVREVTRKEIVAGVYGKVSIHELKSDDGYPMMAISSDEWHKNKTVHIPMSHEDLTAAIATLTEIRDAMVKE